MRLHSEMPKSSPAGTYDQSSVTSRSATGVARGSVREAERLRSPPSSKLSKLRACARLFRLG